MNRRIIGLMISLSLLAPVAMATILIRVERMNQTVGQKNPAISGAFVVLLSNRQNNPEVIASGLTDINGAFKCEAVGKVRLCVFADGYRFYSKYGADAKSTTIKLLECSNALGSPRVILVTGKGVALFDHNIDGKIDYSDAPDIAIDRYKMTVRSMRDEITFTKNQYKYIEIGNFAGWLKFTVNVGAKQIDCEDMAHLDGEPYGCCIVLSIKGDLISPVRTVESKADVGVNATTDSKIVAKTDIKAVKDVPYSAESKHLQSEPLSNPQTLAQGQYTYTTSGGKITITEYSGSGGVVTIPRRIDGLLVRTIGSNAFSSCSSLTSVTIPDSVKSIEDSAFFSCTGLKSVTIPDSVTSIGDSAFSCCSSMTRLTIGNGVTSIGNSAFENCSSLTSVYFTGNAPRVGSSVFDGANTTTVYYMSGTKGWGEKIGNLQTTLWMQ